MNANSKPEEINTLAVSYLGKPVYFLASLVWTAFARMLAWFVTNAKQRNNEAKEMSRLKASKEKASPRPRQPLVRLKNLPQVRCEAVVLLGAALVPLRARAFAVISFNSTALC